MTIVDNSVEYVFGPSPRRAGWIGLAGIAAGVWWALDPDPRNRVVAAALAVACVVVAVLLVRIRGRLRIGPAGIRVIGPLHQRWIAWPQLARVSSPRTGRFGRAATSLELEIWPDPPAAAAVFPDASAEETELLSFSRFELGADPVEVGRLLLRARRAAE